MAIGRLSPLPYLISRSGEVDPNLAHRIALKCVALAPELTDGKGIEGLDVVRHNVGLRPSRRGGPRLEAEQMAGVGLIVHNYGSRAKSNITNRVRSRWSRISKQLGNGDQGCRIIRASTGD